MQTDKQPRKLISVLILTYEGDSIIEKCINGVSKQYKDGFDVEIIVLDNGSTDKTKELISKIKNVKTLFNKSNQSFTKGFNKLFKASKGEYVLVLSNDVFLSDMNFLHKAFRFLESDKNYAAYAPMSIKSNGSIERIAKREIFLTRLFIDYTLIGPLIRILFRDLALGTKEYDQDNNIEDAEVLQDSSLFLRRSSLDKTKIFNEKMSFYYTEDYLCDYIRSKGYKLYYSIDSCVDHLYRFSTTKMGKIKISWIYAKDAIYFSVNKYGKFISYLIFAPLTLITLLLRICFWFLKGQLSWKN